MNAPIQVSRKKTLYTVGLPGSQLTPALTKDTVIKCAHADQDHWATMPQLTVAPAPGDNFAAFEFPQGPIMLYWGEHLGYQKGFGFNHIWRAHYVHCSTQSAAESAIYPFIVSCLQPGSDVLWQIDSGRSDRLMIFASKKGAIITEQRVNDGLTSYSIVTTIPHRKTKGRLIGAL